LYLSNDHPSNSFTTPQALEKRGHYDHPISLESCWVFHPNKPRSS